MRLLLLLLLTAAAGSLDLFCVARLGGPFASVITGNLVQVGLGVSAPHARLAVDAAIAVAFYAVGVAAATRALRGRRGWYGRTSALVALEVALIAGVVIGWLATHASPGGVATGLLLALAGGAMGVQTGVTSSAGLPRASTTYLTGTLTGVVQGAVAPGPWDGAGLLRLLALLLGAAAGGFLLHFAPLWTPVLPLALVAVVVVAGVATSRGRISSGPG